jgi:3-methyl-2-oxobutanoate hydroxymethyltransferase
MSAHPNIQTPADASRLPVTLPRLFEKKRLGEPIVMVTAYDFPSARAAEEAGVDLVLVGDTAAMVVLGYPGTEPVSMDEMVMLGKAVRRGLKTPLMVGDMPMGSYEASNELAVQSAQRLVKETGCQVVKLEAGGTSVERARAIIRAGIPVMGHVGLTPQTATALGGYKTQGKTAQGAIQLLEDALALQSVGCFSIVFEAVPAAISEAIVEKLDIPAIGIGAGSATAGQVLVYHDLLGITTGRSPKFVKRYAEIHAAMVDGVARYTEEVRSHRFPEAEHVYGIEPEELTEFRLYMEQKDGLSSRQTWDWEPLP